MIGPNVAADACRACGTGLVDARRSYCDDRCKKRYQRGARAGAPDEPKDGIRSVAAATILALGEAGKLHTPAGQAALVLAHRIDASDRDTGAGLASMVKRLDETVASLLEDVQPEADHLDELRVKRDEKRAAAG